MDTEAPHEEPNDVIVIGGGPAGLTAALYCRTHNLKVLVIEGKKFGGQLSQLYPTKFILNYASYPEIRAGYLADLMLHHTKYRDVGFVEKEVVVNVKRDNGIFQVSTIPFDDYNTPDSGSNEHLYLSRTIIMATGMGMFEPVNNYYNGYS